MRTVFTDKQMTERLNNGYLWAAVACIAALCLGGVPIDPVVVILLGFSAVLWVVAYSSLRSTLTLSRIITLLIVAGFFLRLGYILYTGVQTRQHDVEWFGSGFGHAGYIEYLYQNGQLYQQDPTSVWQFYHPPLHYAVAAGLMRVMTALGCDYGRAVESIQYLTLFYSTLCMVLCRRLFGLMGLHGKGKAAAMALICFHPTFILMSGSINNDILSVTLMLGAAVAVLRWWKQPTFRRIVPVALCIGCGMMTKLSAALVAPAVAILFLWRWVRPASLPPIRRPIAQFGGFAAICCPLGLWWSVRNLVRFGTPPAYVPLLSEDNWLYIGQYSVWERLFDWVGYPVQSVFISYGLSEPTLDYNPTIAFLKTAVFGESDLSAQRAAIATPAAALFWVGAVIAVIAFAAMVWSLLREKNIGTAHKCFIGTLYATVFYSYLQFCLVYPHACTQNARYGVPLIVVGALFFGRLIGALRRRRLYPVCWGLYTLCAAFCLLSATVYVMLGA